MSSDDFADIMIFRCRFRTDQSKITRGSRCIKRTEVSLPRVDSSLPLMHYDPREEENAKSV